MYRLSSLSAFWLLIFMLSISSISMAQNDTIQEMLKFRIDDMYEQVKEDLLNVKVSIASKKSENLFVAPFSASVVTKEDIEKAGCNSIMEAFRLVPGLIVQEQTNGNYDIYIRGGSNVQHNTIFSRSANTTTLVMIDNRPIYNYYQGGTFWETIPIDLHDVERIELVRGATSAMYGPNAASGVINIITRKTKEDGLYLVANATQGNFGTVIGNVAAGYKFSEQFSVILSGNLQERERTQNTYYTYTADDYVPREGLPSFPDPILNFPDTDLALHKEGLNLFANFKPSERLQFSLSGGWQDSRVQKVYSENFSTPLNTSLSNTWYGDLQARYNQLTAQFSYQQGTQTEGFNEIVGLKWDFYTIDALVEYSLTIKDKLTIKPGLNFRRALFDDTPYYDESAKQGFLNKRRSIDTRAGYLRTDYLMLKDKLRLIAALRIDKFNFPEDLYFSYQFGANYKFNDRNLLRVVFARANRSANVVDTHVDRILAGLNFFVEGNQETKLLIADMAEAGYRVTIGDNLQLDLEAFYGWSQNFSDFINKASDPSETRQQTLNTPLKTRQSGITLSLNYVLNRLQFKPFVSYQCTRLVNSSLYPYLEDAPAKQSNNNNPTLFNLNSGNGTTIDHEGTPAWYGGFFLNYQPSVKWNLNLSSYFFTDQKYYYFMNTFVNDGTSGIGEVNSKFLLNFKASYRPTSSLSVSVNLRNLLNQQGNEYFNTDKGAIYVLGGISFDF